MTKLQYSAVKALATSPEAYKAFKLSVRNRKGLDQYMNRVWPYYVKRAKEPIVSNGRKIARKKDFEMRLERIEEYMMTSRYWKESIAIPFNREEIIAILMLKSEDIIKKVQKMPKNTNAFKSEVILYILSNFDLRIDVSAETKSCATMKRSLNIAKISSTKTFVIKEIGDLIINVLSFDHNIRIDPSRKKESVVKACIDIVRAKQEFYGITIEINKNGLLEELEKAFENNPKAKSMVIRTMKSMLNMEAKSVLKNLYPHKYKRGTLRVSQNVGIEIEYSGIYVNAHKEMKHLNAVEYICGYDGTNGDIKRDRKRKHYHLRLRELRLRMNGIYSIKALDKLLSMMKEQGCAHCQKSSIHYHIDTRNIGKNDGFSVQKQNEASFNWRKKEEVIGEIVSDSKLVAAMSFIFEEKNENAMNVYLTSGGILFNNEFNTWECRIGSRTLSYSKIVMQILVAIHLTNSIRYPNKNLNKEYIIMLEKIARELY